MRPRSSRRTNQSGNLGKALSDVLTSRTAIESGAMGRSESGRARSEKKRSPGGAFSPGAEGSDDAPDVVNPSQAVSRKGSSSTMKADWCIPLIGTWPPQGFRRDADLPWCCAERRVAWGYCRIACEGRRERLRPPAHSINATPRSDL